MSDTLSGPADAPPTVPGGPPSGPGGPGGPGAGGMGMGPPPGAPPLGFPRPAMRPSMPGAGTRAGGLGKLIQAIAMIQMAIMELPIGSEAHKAALKAAQDLGKHVNLGPETQGVTQTGVGNLLQQIMKNAMTSRAMGPGAQGPPGMPPTTPLPGA